MNGSFEMKNDISKLHPSMQKGVSKATQEAEKAAGDKKTSTVVSTITSLFGLQSVDNKVTESKTNSTTEPSDNTMPDLEPLGTTTAADGDNVLWGVAIICIALRYAFQGDYFIPLVCIATLVYRFCRNCTTKQPTSVHSLPKFKVHRNTVLAILLAFFFVLLGMLLQWGLFSTRVANTTPSSHGEKSSYTGSNRESIDSKIFVSVRRAIEKADETARNHIETAPGIHNKTVIEHGELLTRMCDSLAFKSSLSANPNINIEMPQGIESVSSDFCYKFTRVVSLLKPYGDLLDKEDHRERLAKLHTNSDLTLDFYSTYKEHNDIIMDNGILALKERLLTYPAPAMYDKAVSELFPADNTAKDKFHNAVEAINDAWEVLEVALNEDWWIRTAIVGGAFVLSSTSGGVAFMMRSLFVEWAKQPQFIAQLITSLGSLSIPFTWFGSWVVDKYNNPRGEDTTTTLALATAFTNAALTLSTQFDIDYKSLLTLTDTLIGVQSALEGITELTTWGDLKLKLKASTEDLSAALEQTGISNDKLIDCATCVTPPKVQEALQYTTQVVDCGLAGNSTECQRPNDDTWLQTQTAALSKPFVTRNDAGDPDGVVPMVMFHNGLLTKFASILKIWQRFIDESLPKKAVSELNARATKNTPYVTLKPKLIKAIDAVPSIQQKLDTVIGKIRPHVLAAMIFPERAEDGNADFGNLLKSIEEKKTDGQAYTDGVIHAGVKILSHRHTPKNIAKFTKLDYDPVHAKARQAQGLSMPLFDQFREKTGDALYASFKLFFDMAVAEE